MPAIGRLALLVLCGALTACPSNDPTDGTDPTNDDDTQDTDPTNAGACDSEPVPGFPTSSDPTCVNSVATGTIELVVEWSMPAWETNPDSYYILTAPVVVSLTDDNSDGAVDEFDIPDIVVVTFDPVYWTTGILRAVSGDGSGELWTVDDGQTFFTYAQPAAADIDGDGVVEIVMASPDYKVRAYENDGTLKWTSDQLPAGEWTGFGDAPHIADMDHDGNPEIVVGSAIFDNEGGFIAAGTHGYAQSSYYGSTVTTADIDGNGVDDVVAGNAVYNLDGSDLWYNALEVGFPAVADFDLDGEPDILVVGEGNIRVDDREGNVLVPTVEIPGTYSGSWGGPPVVADFDGDGAPEVGVASWDNFRMFDTDLSLMWTQTLTQDLSSGITGAAAFDFDGDGIAEVVYSDEIAIWILAGPTGEVRGTSPHESNTWLEYPVVVDVDADNHAEILVVGYPGLTVYGGVNNSWGAGRKIWNEYAYHITNVNDDGTIPLVEEPSWELYNSFRSGDLTAGDALDAPDLSVTSLGVCEDECADGNLVLSVQAANEGAVDLTVPVRYEVYGVQGTTRTLIASASGPATLPVGTVAASDLIRITGFVPASADSVVVVVTSDEGDCVAANNEVEIAGPFCGSR